MQVNEAIRTKRAVRQFEDKPLDTETVEAILNAGRRAQSSRNSQAWRFLAVQDRETLQALGSLRGEHTHLADAALGVLILTPDPGQRLSIMFDAGQAASYMQLAAWELGVGSCIIGLRDPGEARRILSVPEDWHLHLGLSFGYPDAPEAASAAPKAGGRRSLDEVVHYDRWEE